MTVSSRIASANMSDNMQQDPHSILCDMCADEDRKPARKTCMKCEISMCVQHLQAHLTTPVLLQTHPLTEPIALSGTTKCPHHGKLLEYYCLDDMTCVCVSCAIEDEHRLHNMKTFSTAHKELMETLKAEQQALQVKTEDENVSLEKWEKGEREKLGGCSVRLIEAVKSLRDVSLTSVQSSVSARMVSIKTSKSSMEEAQNEKDTFRFLQMYSQVHEDVEKAKAVDLRKGLEPGSDRDKLVQEIRQGGEKMLEQAGQFWCSLLTLVDPENHQEPFATSSDLTFDPQTFGPSLSFSKDNRKVFYNSWLGQCFATLLMRSIQSVPNFHRWMVSFSTDCDWTIGLCDKQYTQGFAKGPVYGLCCKNNHLSCLTTECDDCCDALSSSQGSGTLQADMTKAGRQLTVSSTPITYQVGDDATPRPEMVKVFWNFVASTLSFFSRTRQHQREEITTIKMSFNSLDLVPFVRLEHNQNMSQLQQKCTCLGVPKKFKDLYQQPPPSSHQANCACSRPGITEEVCKLC